MGAGAMEQFAKAACVPPACRDDGIGFLTGLRWRRHTAVDAGGSDDANS